MERRTFLSLAAGSAAGSVVRSHLAWADSRTGADAEPAASPPLAEPPAEPHAAAPEQLHPGVWKLTLGAPDGITPVRTRRYAPAGGALAAMPAAGAADAACTLYEDGGHAPALTEVVLSWEAARRSGSVRRAGAARQPHYHADTWTRIA